MLCCRCSLAEIKEKSSEAYQMLDTWKQSYLEMRKKIEQSGRDARWEFDRKRLFERSDHISNVCKDIYKIAQVPFTTCISVKQIVHVLYMMQMYLHVYTCIHKI